MKMTNELLNCSINFLKKSFQDIVIDKNEYQSLCNIFTKYVDETKIESFIQI